TSVHDSDCFIQGPRQLGTGDDPVEDSRNQDPLRQRITALADADAAVQVELVNEEAELGPDTQTGHPRDSLAAGGVAADLAAVRVSPVRFTLALSFRVCDTAIMAHHVVSHPHPAPSRQYRALGLFRC